MRYIVIFITFIIWSVLTSSYIFPVNLSQSLKGFGVKNSPRSPESGKITAEMERKSTQELLLTYTRLHESFIHQLLCCIDAIEHELLYWREQKLRPLASLIESGPHRWLLEKSHQEQVEEHITCLELEQKHHIYYLGMSSLQKKVTPQVDFDRLVAICTQEMDIIQNWAEHKNALAPDVPIAQHLIEYIDVIKKSSKDFQLRIVEHKQPSHLNKHLIGYSAATIASILLAAYLYNNSEKLPVWRTKLTEACYKFIDDHVITPLSKAKERFFGEYSPSLVIKEQDIQRELKYAKDGLSFYIKNNHAEITEQKRQTMVEEIDKSVVEEDIIHNMQSPKYNLLNPQSNFLAAILNEFQIQKVRVLQGFVKVDELIEDNRLLFALFATVPACLVAYGTYKASKNTYRWLRKTNFEKPVKTLLIECERLLNVISSDEAKSPAYFGQIVYWAHKLATYIPAVPLEHRINFERDISELAEPSITTTQKISIIHRMYHAYEFLYPQILRSD